MRLGSDLAHSHLLELLQLVALLLELADALAHHAAFDALGLHQNKSGLLRGARGDGEKAGKVALTTSAGTVAPWL